MKKKIKTVLFFVCPLIAGAAAFADDLVVGREETLNLSSDAVYDTVTVHGTLNIESGAKLTAAVLELGPDAGDAALVNVLGSDATGLEAETVNIGRNGGAGQIVALSDGAVHNTGWDKVFVVKMTTVNICANAALSSSGFIDFLKLGPGTVDFKTMNNESASRARILVKDGCLGYTQYWGVTMFDSGSFRIEAFDGGGIRLGSGYSLRYINSTLCSLVIDGNGADVVFCRYADSDDQCYTLREGVEWVDVRNIYITERHPVKLTANDLLPYGLGFGGVILGESELNILQIGNTVQHLNYFSSPLSLDKVSLRGEAQSKVFFGSGDQDGFLKGRIGADVGVFKVGTGTFSITNAAQVGSFTVSNGTVRVAAEFNLEKLVVEAGATLVIDGVTVGPFTGLAEIKGELVLLNGGKLKTSRTVVNDERIVGFSEVAAGEWTKLGMAKLILEDPACMPSNIHVKAGSISFTAPGYACDLFKWNVTDWNNIGWRDANHGVTNDMFYLSELAFVDSADNRIGALNIATAPIGTAPEALPSGSAAFAGGTELITAGGSGNAGRLFDTNHWPRVGVASPLVTDEGGVTLYVRLPAESQAVSAINFAGAYGGLPRSWTLSGSIDGGNTWHVLNETSGYEASEDMTWKTWMGNTGEDIESFTVPKAFPFYCADTGFTVPGVRNMPPVMRLEVSAGAVADFTNVTGGQLVDALTLDAAEGGGIIKNVSFAESGTVFLKNLPSGTALRDLSVPLTLESAKNVDNLAGWRICVDGVMHNPEKYKAVYCTDGFLRITAVGMVIIVR